MFFIKFLVSFEPHTLVFNSSVCSRGICLQPQVDVKPVFAMAHCSDPWQAYKKYVHVRYVCT